MRLSKNDQELLSEAYESVMTKLNPTVNLEDVANFLNKNQVYNGAPVKGAGGWYVYNSVVTNDDAEGGYSGISVMVTPEKEGLVAHRKIEADKHEKKVFPWPVEAKEFEAFMQSKSSNL
jgi:hypothetical protein